MRRTIVALVMLGAAAASGAARAQSEDLCSDRPGLTSDTCLVNRGQVTLETSLVDWTVDKRMGDREDMILFGDSVVRAGIADGLEIDLGWTPLGYDRMREDGEVTKRTRVGDVSIGGRASLFHPEGDAAGPSASVVATVSLPAGREPIGDGDWGATLTVPLAYKLGDVVNIEVTPEIDAAVDEDGDGRHFAYGVAAGVEFNLTPNLLFDIDGQVKRDRDPDPDERGTLALANLALAWQPDKRTQLDIGTNIGLDAASPDVAVIAGFTRAF